MLELLAYRAAQIVPPVFLCVAWWQAARHTGSLRGYRSQLQWIGLVAVTLRWMLYFGLGLHSHVNRGPEDWDRILRLRANSSGLLAGLAFLLGLFGGGLVRVAILFAAIGVAVLWVLVFATS